MMTDPSTIVTPHPNTLINEPCSSVGCRGVVYACPVKGCSRSAESGRKHFFKLCYNLKMVSFFCVRGEPQIVFPK